MKVKVKLDMQSIKLWMLEHGEKLAFGIVVVVFLLFTYFAARREVLDANHQPDKLASLAEDIRRYVGETKWDGSKSELQVVDYSKRALREPVALVTYTLTRPFSPPLADDKARREDPVLFNVEEPRAAAGYATFALVREGGAAGPGRADDRPRARAAGEGGDAPPPRQAPAAQNKNNAQLGRRVKPTRDSRLTGRPWVVVTALVPVEKQAQEFARVFSRSMGANPDRDALRYFGLILERAEANDSSPDKLAWGPVESPEAFEEKWDSSVEELIAPEHYDPTLTGRLGPIVDVDWGESITHPKIPLADGAEQKQHAKPAEVAVKEPEEVKLVAGGQAFTTKRHAVAAVAAPPPAADKADPAAAKVTPYKLLRIFDYSVEPNKKYRYRIKLGVLNPNYAMSPGYLKNPEAPSNKEQVRVTDDWSEPTGVVAVPDSYGVLAGSVDSKSSEPTAKILLTMIDKETGIPSSAEVTAQRGFVANKKEKLVKALDPSTHDIVEIEDAEFKGGMVVLDLYGGRSISVPRRKEPLSAPGAVLLLDANGNLMVRNDLEDASQFSLRKPPEEEEPRKASKEITDDAKSKKPVRTRTRS